MIPWDTETIFIHPVNPCGSATLISLSDIPLATYTSRRHLCSDGYISQTHTHTHASLKQRYRTMNPIMTMPIQPKRNMTRTQTTLRHRYLSSIQSPCQRLCQRAIRYKSQNDSSSNVRLHPMRPEMKYTARLHILRDTRMAIISMRSQIRHAIGPHQWSLCHTKRNSR
jgi:hypothetical protein